MTPYMMGLIGGIVFCVIMGVGGGVLTQLTPWYYNLRQPAWKPPDWAFGPVWTTVFIFLTLAIATAWSTADEKQRMAMLLALAVNGVLNIAWSGIFFMLKNPKLAFIELLLFWASIVLLIVVMGSISRTAGWLLAPYLLWVSIAGVLNFQVMQLNRT
jgi:translocator protein